jgi:isopentenyldiphosphate isomerase
MSYLDHIHAHNNADLSQFRPFYVADKRVGWIPHEFMARLAAWPNVFGVEATRVTLAPGLDDFFTLSDAVEVPLRALASAGVISGWREEAYPVKANWGDAPLMQIERAACTKFGIRAWGVYMNGFVKRDDGTHMWVAHRAKDKPTCPGMLDNMVAGGQPIGISPHENLIKECWEEAGIPKAISALARPVSVVSYCQQTADGVKPNQMFCYDLEVPVDFTPVNEDGEVDRFELWPLEDVIASVGDSFDFKSNCNLAVIDFLVRHGYITPENEPDYMAIVLGLRSSA